MKPKALVCCAGLTLSVAAVARGQVINWANPSNGNWGVATNWNPVDVPDTGGEHAVLGLTGPYAATIAGSVYAIGSLTVSNPAAELRLDASDAAGFTVLVLTATSSNQGLVRLTPQPTTNNSRLQINTNGIAIGGAGELRLEEAGDTDLYINIGGGGTFTNGPSHRITGTGTITGAGAVLINQGSVLGNRAGGLTITNHLDNAGTVRAVLPGAMTLGSGVIVNQSASGFIEADNTTVTLAGCTINNNPVRSVNGGLITLAPGISAINGITAGGDWQIPANDAAGYTALLVNGGFTNNALIRLSAEPTANNARLQIQANGQTIGGSGEIRLAEADDTDLYINIGGGGTFTNGSGHTISGVGTINGAGATFLNAGRLAPGAPLGSLRLFNHTTLLPTSVVEIELGGDAAGQRDSLDGTGANIALGGTLRITLRDGYILPPCTSHVVVRGNLSGIFAVEDLPVMPQGVISVSYGPNTVVIGYIPGDLNGDGLLDFADYLQFLNLYDAQDIRADLNGDGLVDFTDYLEFLNLYDASC